MKCVPQRVDGSVACAACRIPFHAKTVAAIDAMGGDLSRLHRDCESTAALVGPGTELTDIFASLGAKADCKSNCRKRRLQMNEWGVAGCREHRDEIVEWVREAYGLTTWLERRNAELLAISTGLAFKINWRDPIPSIVDESIRRAESRAT